MRGLAAVLVVALALVAGGSVAPGPALADGPLLQGSPWPEMRHDLRNTGESQIRGAYRGERPWSFTTQRGIFSTPVIDDRGVVYVGSADGNFYALGRDGSKLWRFRTGGIIDAAAALGLRAGPNDEFPITIGSGDETLYQLRGTPKQLSAAKRTRWTFRTPLAPATGQLVNWWEGNVAYGPDSNLYVGNTGGGAFSLTPDGRQRWVTQRANSVWTTPAFDAEGNSYWGSVDFYAFSLDPAGNQRWQTFTPGYLTSSPALGSDGTVYIGSFDRSLHALDPATGAERWAFPTADHIYSSPALASDAAGNTKAIYIGSADGSIYAVAPDGTELWSYDTGDPVRSSPVLGRAPKGDGKIVYVGSSNGVLYALDAETGKRRWSFDTTPGKAGLADRNDLNGSPALGKRGVYIGGEHGRVWFVPYDFCRKSDNKRCTTDPSPEFKPTVTRTFAVTPGRHDPARLDRERARGDHARRPAGRAPRRRDDRRRDRPGLPQRHRQALVHLHQRALRRRALPLHPPRRDPQAGDRLPGADVRRLDRRGRQRHLQQDPALRHRPAAPQAHGPGDPERRGAGDRAHPPRAAAAGAAAEREPDRLRLLRPDRGMAHAAALEPGQAAAVGDRRAGEAGRHHGRRPRRRLRFPAFRHLRPRSGQRSTPAR